MLKIVQIIPALHQGGAERTVVEITRAIVDAGGQALTITRGGDLEHEVLKAGGQIAHVPVHSKNPLIMWQNSARIARLADAFGAHILHARSRAPAWSTRSACIRLGLPFVTTYHGAYSARSSFKRRYNAIMSSGDMVIANSNFIARHIMSEHSIDAQHITVIARGVDPVFFDVPEDKETPATEGPLILLPARFTRLKGHKVALDALALLHQHSPMARLVFAGSAHDRNTYLHEIKHYIAQRGLNRFVDFAGHVRAMEKFYAKADIVLNASTSPESFGRTIVEAQASARLAVAPAHGGTLETLSNDKTGFHFVPGDATDLARVLHKALCLDPAKSRKIRMAAREHVRSHYSREVMCAKTLGVYRDLVKLKASQ